MVPSPPTAPTSLYVHVPFCVVKCGYCDFTSYVVEDETVHDRFVVALAAELQMAAVPPQPCSVFLGGGTPTHLSPTRLQQLFEHLVRHVDLARCAEVTMEANPESVSREKIEIALRHGVRRFSMGVQTFDPQRLRFLDRAHSPERVREAMAVLRAAGAENVSLDLIFGLPGQTVPEWEADLAQALELRPDHLSCYNLTFEPGTRLTHDLRLGRVHANDEAVDARMFARTRELLAAAGFVAYEISNFAGRGGPCRHNDHYWLQGDYVGVGPGASSHRHGQRWTNLKSIDAWAASALAAVPPVASAETLTPHQRLGEALWLGLRRSEGVDVAAAERRIGWRAGAELAAIRERQQKLGWIECVDSRIRLTPSGLLRADSAGADYLAADERPRPIAHTPSESR